MAEQMWRGVSLHQERFDANRARARVAAAELTEQFVTDVTGEIVAEREASTHVEVDEFDPMEGARKLLRSPRQKAKEAAAARAERLQKRHDEHEREQAKEPTAAGVVGLSEAQFRASAERAFKSLTTVQAAALVEVAREAESRAWAREAEKDETDYTPITDPDAYHADQATDEDDDELTGLE